MTEVRQKKNMLNELAMFWLNYLQKHIGNLANISVITKDDVVLSVVFEFKK